MQRERTSAATAEKSTAAATSTTSGAWSERSPRSSSGGVITVRLCRALELSRNESKSSSLSKLTSTVEAGGSRVP
eukprot:1132747-Prymnesium_polylepis.1